MPRFIRYSLLILAALALVPLVLVVHARQDRSEKTRIHPIPDMDNQPRYGAQAENPAFADGRAMRLPVEGVLAADAPTWGPEVRRGQRGEAWVTRIPIPITDRDMRRGRERYDIYCAPCHGYSGRGDGMVSKRAESLQEGTWVPASDLVSQVVMDRADGDLYNTVGNGIRSMPAYRFQLAIEDRWAIVAYVRALQRSQNTTLDDVPPSRRDDLLPE